jgi:formylglycine-generating enzyme required for sulfatase activity
MSWLKPTEYEQVLLENARSNWPDVVELAKYTVLTPRIEPLLLRNIRSELMPASEPELEFRFWFSALVSARSTRNVILHQGVARLLADELSDNADEFNKAWEYTKACTVHWDALDRLEQQLRYDAMQKNQQQLKNGLQEVLRAINRAEDDETRLNLARWAKKTLPAIAGETTTSDETAWLAQYAATVLGATANWTQLSSTNPIPDWLDKPSSTFFPGKIGLQLRYDSELGYQVLECLSADDAEMVLALPTPLPAKLFIQCENEPEGHWEVINTGSRIKLPLASHRIELRTIDGKSYELLSQLLSDFLSAQSSQPVKIYLAYVSEDKELAYKISGELAQHKIKVTLLQESLGATPFSGEQDSEVKLLRLWTPAAQLQWEKMGLGDSQLATNSLLLQWNQAKLPQGAVPSQVINLDETQHIAQDIKQWLENSKTTKPELEKEIDALLKEIENPVTRPRRRLEIGDRLAEIGDPRKGVGVREYEIIEYPQEIQRLLDELDDIRTEPPRRLEIGNRLAELGDPRPGVGLDENGLPDIDWVEIPAGPFIYGEGEYQQTIDLSRYYISRYPVTNSQYQAFIDAEGYSDERWWQDLIKPEQEAPEWKQGNRPRETVNWYEALAFSRWLSAQRGVEITLPTEQQWEKAARGTDGRIFPWGGKPLSDNELSRYANRYANVESDYWNLKQTTAVGMYPQGSSPYGIMDMAGNLWELCLNKRDSNARNCILCGGSWNHSPFDARSFNRMFDFLDYRDPDGGFRVVCSLPQSTNT